LGNHIQKRAQLNILNLNMIIISFIIKYWNTSFWAKYTGTLKRHYQPL